MVFLKRIEIQVYSIHWDQKAVSVERFNGTLLDLIKEPMFIEGKACWLNNLDVALEKYNNRVSDTTKMTPFEMSIKNKPILNLIPGSNNNNLTKFQVGDYVRFPDERKKLFKRLYQELE